MPWLDNEKNLQATRNWRARQGEDFKIRERERHRKRRAALKLKKESE